MIATPSLSPIVIRAIAVAAVIAAAWGAGFVSGIRSEADRNSDEAAAIAGATAKQIAATAAKVDRQKTITNEVANAYSQAVLSLRADLVDARRVRLSPGSDPGAVPAVPVAAAGADEGSADDRPDTGTPAPAEDACAMTTLQLIWLQNWWITTEYRQ